ncbi:MAG: hypothetical protein IKP76_04895 [Bacilli bacterium]|nr:hypothetical protein [Bacilli bacterium]
MSRRIKWLDHYKSYYDVYFQPKRLLKNEIKYAKWLSKYFNSDVYMVPQVKTNGVRTPDYWVERTNQYWDLKMLNGNSKSIIDNVMNHSKNQTNRIVFVIGKTNFSINNIEKQLYKCMFGYQRRYIKEIILKNKKGKMIIHIKRK